jgi:hypothetical protein
MSRLSGPVAKGSTFLATLEFLRESGGAALTNRVLRGLSPADRKTIQGLTPTGEAPFPLLLRLWRSVDVELGPRDPGWAERAGGFSIESGGKRLYGGILQKESPLQFLTQSISLFRLYYHPGDMEVVEVAPQRAVLRLVGFPSSDRLFCRRQTGGLQSALTIAGGLDPSVRHVRCELEGDAFCEWELRWQ